MQPTDERPLDDLTLLVYPGAPTNGDGVWSGVGVLYEDDGATRAHLRDEYALTEVRSAFNGGAVRVEVDAVRGTFAGQPAARDLTIRVRMDDRPGEIRVRRGDQAISVPERAVHPADDTGTYWSYDVSGWANVRLFGTDPRRAITVELSS
jgi:hypothetical protein